MKKLLMLLLVLVFSFALCLSVSAHDTEPADTPPTETEVTEAANASGGCNHGNYNDNGPTYVKDVYCGPAICKHVTYVDITCNVCGIFLWKQEVSYTISDHSWREHDVKIDGSWKYCQYCSVCGYHTRIH